MRRVELVMRVEFIMNLFFLKGITKNDKLYQFIYKSNKNKTIIIRNK